ncbi:MAG TPA: hypothetical protein VEB18_02040 [Candidatus Paceibacterota bacterium]|nr:hypothetical protein [Candidatus Paceibacterota bacterium]
MCQPVKDLDGRKIPGQELVPSLLDVIKAFRVLLIRILATVPGFRVDVAMRAAARTPSFLKLALEPAFYVRPKVSARLICYTELKEGYERVVFWKKLTLEGADVFDFSAL